MAQIDPKMVKALRQRTGAPMMDCKRALEESGGDQEKAQEALRKKGLQSADKKAGREASEGLVFSHVSEDRSLGVLVGLACETDFVARNEQFVQFGNGLCTAVVGLEGEHFPGEALGGRSFTAGAGTIDERRRELVGVIGENIQIVEAFRIAAGPDGRVFDYVHHNGKLGVLAVVGCEDTGKLDDDAVSQFGKHLSMTIAAMQPRFLTREDVDPAVVEKERQVVRAQTEENMRGKPPEIIEKAVEGRLGKFLADICLLEQPWVLDSSKTVDAMRKELGRSLGTEVTVGGFRILQLGA